jgi:hypothetical protein
MVELAQQFDGLDAILLRMFVSPMLFIRVVALAGSHPVFFVGTKIRTGLALRVLEQEEMTLTIFWNQVHLILFPRVSILPQTFITPQQVQQTLFCIGIQNCVVDFSFQVQFSVILILKFPHCDRRCSPK